MTSIRDLACKGEADDALILTRSLLLIVARALYLIEPDDLEERARRLASARRSWARDAVRTLDDLTATGFEPADDRERIAGIEEAEKARGIPPLPNDRDLLGALGLDAYYARVYRLASDTVHYSIGSALHGFLEEPDPVIGGGRVPMKNPDGERAEEALALAMITYGEFLDRSEPIVRHGVGDAAQRLAEKYFEERRAAEDKPGPDGA
jgi:Family of unknown function (DUF5677)